MTLIRYSIHEAFCSDSHSLILFSVTRVRLNTPVYRGEDTQSRLFGGSPPESPRRLSTSSVGSGINVSPGFLIKASHQRSNIFASDPVPAVRSPNGNSNVPMSPGRLIKESQRRSNIFPQQAGQQPTTSFNSSGASSVADLTGSEAGAGTPVRSVNGNGIVHMSPGRLIKASHQRSNIFPQTDSSRNSSSASSSVDLAESENGRSFDPVSHADILHH